MTSEKINLAMDKLGQLTTQNSTSFLMMSSFGTECMKNWDMYQIKTDNTNCVKMKFSCDMPSVILFSTFCLPHINMVAFFNNLNAICKNCVLQGHNAISTYTHHYLLENRENDTKIPL